MTRVRRAAPAQEARVGDRDRRARISGHRSTSPRRRAPQRVSGVGRPGRPREAFGIVGMLRALRAAAARRRAVRAPCCSPRSRRGFAACSARASARSTGVMCAGSGARGAAARRRARPKRRARPHRARTRGRARPRSPPSTFGERRHVTAGAASGRLDLRLAECDVLRGQARLHAERRPRDRRCARRCRPSAGLSPGRRGSVNAVAPARARPVPPRGRQAGDEALQRIANETPWPARSGRECRAPRELDHGRNAPATARCRARCGGGRRRRAPSP